MTLWCGILMTNYKTMMCRNFRERFRSSEDWIAILRILFLSHLMNLTRPFQKVSFIPAWCQKHSCDLKVKFYKRLKITLMLWPAEPMLTVCFIKLLCGPPWLRNDSLLESGNSICWHLQFFLMSFRSLYRNKRMPMMPNTSQKLWK